MVNTITSRVAIAPIHQYRYRDHAGDLLKMLLWPKAKGQRREPAADDVGVVSERIGWLPFAGPLLCAPDMDVS
jgi:hypothetical protein